MFEAMTIGNFKILCDIIISIRDKILPGTAHRTHNFDQIVDPIFKALQLVVDDYFVFFRTTAVEMEELTREGSYELAVEKLSKIINKLRQDRERMLSNRIVIKAMADDLIKRTHDEKYSKFYHSVSRIFDSVDVPYKTGQKVSAAQNILTLANQLTEDPMNNKVSPYTLLWALQASIVDIEQKWGAVAQSYARLRFDCLSRTRVSHIGASLLHGS